MDKAISYGPPMMAARKRGPLAKTETRRLLPASLIINLDPGRYKCHGIDTSDQGSVEKPVVLFEDLRPEITPWITPIPVPFAVGDRTYVKEVWRTLRIYNELKPVEVPDDAPIWYDADGPAPAEFGKYRYARFMPRKFARFWDEVTAVRCERVQDITEAAAIAEGYSFQGFYELLDEADQEEFDLLNEDYDEFAARKGFSYQREWYRMLWQEINGPDSWAANPWVFVIQYKELSRAGHPDQATSAVLAETAAATVVDTGGIALTPELEQLLDKHPGQQPAVLAGYELGLGNLREVLAELDKPRQPTKNLLGAPATCINELPGPFVRILNVAVAATLLKYCLPFGVQDSYFSKDELRGLRFIGPHLDTFLANITKALATRKVFTVASSSHAEATAGVHHYTEGMSDLLSLVLGDLNSLGDPREGQGAIRMYTELNLVQEIPAEAWDKDFGIDAAPVAEEMEVASA